MTGLARTLYMPDGLELMISEDRGVFRLDGYQWRIRRANLITGTTGEHLPSDSLRAERFRTVEQLVEALRREIAKDKA